MLKLRKKVLSAALAAAITVSATQIPVWSEDEAAPIADGAVAETTETGDSQTTVFVTEEEAFSKMSLIAENSSLALYFNEEDYIFCVENKENGYKWWSAPYNNDPDANATYFSKRTTLLSIEVINTDTKNPEVLRAHGSNVKKSFKKIENGIRIEFEFIRTAMVIPLEITLQDGYFNATVPVAGIKENRPTTTPEGDIGYELLSVNVLENFGATDRSHDGIMIVPDGSGAVINYNNGTASGDVNTYTGVVYGRDLAVSLLEAEDVIEQVTMPVAGRITDGASEDNGLVMIATSGDEFSTIRAAVTGQDTVTDLNTCWFEFALRTQDKYFMGSDNTPLSVYESKGIKTGDVTVSYYPINDAELSYVDVAEEYRDYLINQVGVTKKTTANDNPFYLTLYGGTVKEQSILGIPVEIQTTATTYSEALEIIKKLEERGVTNIKLVYEDFNKSGIIGEISSTFEYSSKLGGKDDYKVLADHVKAQGYEIFPSCDIMEMNQSGNGYSFTLNASKQITNSYATQTPFELAFGLPHLTKDSTSILSPYYIGGVFDKLVKSFKEEGATGISLNQAGHTLYSDFSRKNADGRNYLTRADAMKILQDGHQKLADAGMTIMSENANQYLLKYSDYIKDVPLYSSNYDIFDYDIPFAQMVLHGLVPYTTKAINKSANAEELRLLSLVSGTPIHYEMMYKNPNKFSDSEYDTLYYSNYIGWLDYAGNEYKLFSDTIAKVSDSYITDYERISDVEYRSTFENGTTIYVNLDTQEIEVDGKAYDLSSYGLGVSE